MRRSVGPTSGRGSSLTGLVLGLAPLCMGCADKAPPPSWPEPPPPVLAEPLGQSPDESPDAPETSKTEPDESP